MSQDTTLSSKAGMEVAVKVRHSHALLMMLLMMHQHHFHRPWRLDRCYPFISSSRGVRKPKS